MKTRDETSSLKQFLLNFHPSALLLAVQLLQLAIFMFFDQLPNRQTSITIIGIVVLLLVVWVVDHSPGINWVAWILAVPAFVLSIFSMFIPGENLSGWAAFLQGSLYFYGAISLIVYMMEDNQVTIDELFAVGATFTLFAWGFAFFYLACQFWLPGSFYSMVIIPARPLTFIELLSLSFTNLTATGLSDILATTTPARILIMLEQFCGIGYVAVVVSRLIGMTLKGKKKTKGTALDGKTQSE